MSATPVGAAPWEVLGRRLQVAERRGCLRPPSHRSASCNAGASPDSGFAATSLLAGSPTSRIFSLALGLDSFAFCLCGSLHLRDPGSFSFCCLGRFALDLAGG